jgi:general secretion pathway protein H
MACKAAKVKMRILALGNDLPRLALSLSSHLLFKRKQKSKPREKLHGKVRGKVRGFTLIELMVVVAIIAIASAGVLLAIPDASATALEREAQRLAALLDSARAQSRASGLAVTWRPTEDGFVFDGIPQIKNSRTGELEDVVKFPKTWLNADTKVDASSRLALGPEPVIAQQEVVLQHEARSLTLATDGIRPFTIKSSE